jgi:probable HAF family extracellular repeat protein
VKRRGLAAALGLSVLLLSSAQARTGPPAQAGRPLHSKGNRWFPLEHPLLPTRQVRYTVRDLGTLGGLITAAGDINALGQVVGFSMTTDGFLHAFSWSKGKMTDLGTLGGQSSYATAVNNAGVVVGYSQIAGSQDSHAFLWRKGAGMRDLGTLGGAQSFATDVNDLGIVVGRAFDSSDTPHGFAWIAKSGMRQLEGDPFSTAAAVGAGANGPIAGAAGLPLVPGTWAGAGAQFSAISLPAGFDQGQPYGLDAGGDVVGTIGTGSGLARGFYRQASAGARDLGAPFHIQNSEAYAVSNSRRIVGVAYNDPFGTSYGWLLSSPGGTMQLLADLAATPAWAFSSPAAINDLGQIVGTGQHNGLPRGFLVTPAQSDQATSLRSFALGGRGFHAKVRRTLDRALSDLSHGKKRRACASLGGLGRAASREPSLSKPVRGIFAVDIRGFRRGLSCPGA